MSSRKPKNIYSAKNIYPNQAAKENINFPEVTTTIQKLDTDLLLLSSTEDAVLVTIFKSLTEFARKQDENIVVLKEKKLLGLLVDKEMYISTENVLIRRFALYVSTTLLEHTNTLVELTTEMIQKILELCVRYYVFEKDDYGLEYLSVMINKCLDDPQVAHIVLTNEEFIKKMFTLTTKTENPDTLLHSLEIIYKLLLVQNTEENLKFTTQPIFPIDRVLCDLSNEFADVRNAALKLVKMMIVDTGEGTPFAPINRAIYVLQQLTRVLCDENMTENSDDVVSALATALRTERMSQFFFEYNLFEKITQNMEAHPEMYIAETRCKINAIFAEAAKYLQYLSRLHAANITEHFLICLLPMQGFPFTHVLVGLNRMMKLTEAANRIVAAYEEGLLSRLTELMMVAKVTIKTREQTVEFLNTLLIFAFHPTATELMILKLPRLLGAIFGLKMEDLSIDYILLLLTLIENLAQNNEYRFKLGESQILTINLNRLLKNSFKTAILVSNIFRCFCTLIDEEEFRTTLLGKASFIASIKRGLKSLSNLVKTAVTNFIMQTTRFPALVEKYIHDGVLEVLILNQKHAFCVSTWVPAIDSILSKSPTFKFCIRNNLGFTDNTVGHDFYISKRKLEDFRQLLSILKEEVSPLYPVLVVNFERPEDPPEFVVTVPQECLRLDQSIKTGDIWCYCRRPGDDSLPRLLTDLTVELEEHNLLQNPPKVQRCIDFDNIAKRAKVIAQFVVNNLSDELKILDINAPEECARHVVRCHLKDLSKQLHCNLIPLGLVRSGCQFERAILFKALADQIGLPCTLQRSVDGVLLFNEVPLPLEIDKDVHCDENTMKYIPWRMLRPTHMVDLMYNIGELYPLQSRQALQYLRLY